MAVLPPLSGQAASTFLAIVLCVPLAVLSHSTHTLVGCLGVLASCLFGAGAACIKIKSDSLLAASLEVNEEEIWVQIGLIAFVFVAITAILDPVILGVVILSLISYVLTEVYLLLYQGIVLVHGRRRSNPGR